MQNRQIKMFAVVADNAVGFFQNGPQFIQLVFRKTGVTVGRVTIYGHYRDTELFKVIVHIRESILGFYVKNYFVGHIRSLLTEYGIISVLLIMESSISSSYFKTSFRRALVAGCLATNKLQQSS